MSITRIQKRYITYEITFEQKELNLEVLTDDADEWQIVDAGPEPPFTLFDYVSQEEIEAACNPDI